MFDGDDEEVPGRVFHTRQKERFFFVPIDVELPEGELLLQAGSVWLEVDPEAAAPYEIDREEAARRMNEAVARGLDHVRGAWRALLERGRGRAPIPEAIKDLDLEQVFGMSAGELYTHPEKGEEAGRAALAFLGKLVGPLVEAAGATVDDGQRRAKTQQGLVELLSGRTPSRADDASDAFRDAVDAVLRANLEFDGNGGEP